MALYWLGMMSDPDLGCEPEVETCAGLSAPCDREPVVELGGLPWCRKCALEGCDEDERAEVVAALAEVAQ